MKSNGVSEPCSKRVSALIAPRRVRADGPIKDLDWRLPSTKYVCAPGDDDHDQFSGRLVITREIASARFRASIVAFNKVAFRTYKHVRQLTTGAQHAITISRVREREANRTCGIRKERLVGEKKQRSRKNQLKKKKKAATYTRSRMCHMIQATCLLAVSVTREAN